MTKDKEMTKIHYLKIEDCYLDNLLSGKKKVEIRFNDRDYQVRDILRFHRWKEGTSYFRITHIHSGLGMDTNGCGYVALSLEKCEVEE